MPALSSALVKECAASLLMGGFFLPAFQRGGEAGHSAGGGILSEISSAREKKSLHVLSLRRWTLAALKEQKDAFLFGR